MDATTEAATVERHMTIDAKPETVWEFLVDPDKATRWMGQQATFEARPGGIYRCEVIPGHVALGEFVELDPPNRLVFTWGWEPAEKDDPRLAPGSSTIEIELTPEGDGTMLRFVHRDLPSVAAADSHSVGWDHYLPRLVTAAGGGDPGADPWLTRPMETDG
jgi:uncharacterized protein YndB with AHSA1/START domain